MAVAQRFEGGVLVGYNATQVKGDSYRGYHKPGLLAGVFVQTDIMPAVFAGMEIKYSQKGARHKVDKDEGIPDKYIMRLEYVDIPFFIGYRTSSKGTVIGGISAGYLFRAKEIDEYGEFPEEEQNRFEDFDLQPFVGFQFDMAERLRLDLRLAYSILPIRGLPRETNYYWLNSQFNNVISLALYYSLDR